VSSSRPRFDLETLAPGAERAIEALDTHVATLGVEPRLLELIRVRASQLNGCAYCIDVHAKDARARGEAEHRLHALAAWRETPFFSARERAALAWAEAVTLVAEGRVSDAALAEARAALTDEEIAAVLLATIAINAWNRVAIGQRLVPGRYVSPHTPLGAVA
jgi:AhpD family alkylhydroperoxidase